MIAAADGADALATFDAGPVPDLVISDVVMPGTLQGPVIYMSGYARESTQRKFAIEERDEWLTKPLTRQELERAIRRVCR